MLAVPELEIELGVVVVRLVLEVAAEVLAGFNKLSDVDNVDEVLGFESVTGVDNADEVLGFESVTGVDNADEVLGFDNVTGVDKAVDAGFFVSLSATGQTTRGLFLSFSMDVLAGVVAVGFAVVTADGAGEELVVVDVLVVVVELVAVGVEGADVAGAEAAGVSVSVAGSVTADGAGAVTFGAVILACDPVGTFGIVGVVL